MKRNILSTGEESNRFARKNYLIHLSRHCKFAFYSTTMPFPHTCIHTHTHTPRYTPSNPQSARLKAESSLFRLCLYGSECTSLPPSPTDSFLPFSREVGGNFVGVARNFARCYLLSSVADGGGSLAICTLAVHKPSVGCVN